MVGGVQVEHISLQRLEHLTEPSLIGHLSRRQGVGRVLDEALVLQDHGHVIVAGDEPGRFLVGKVMR